MRNFKFLIGALGGALGGYLLSNPTLRKKLQNAKDPQEAATILGKELQRSGKKVAKEAQEWLESEPVQGKLGEAKRFVRGHAEELKQKAQTSAKGAARKAKKKAKSTYRKARRRVSSAGSS